MANVLDLQNIRTMAAQMAQAGGNCISVLSVAQLRAEATDQKSAAENLTASASQHAAPPGNCISVLSVATLA
jgi:hypothetical protein